MKSDFESGPFTEAEKLGLRCADRLHHSPREIDDEFYAKLKTAYQPSPDRGTHRYGLGV